MKKYYTRACNFYYGSVSKEKIKKKLSLPLNGNNLISFDTIEIINRKYKKKVHIKKIKNQSNIVRKKIKDHIKLITIKKKNQRIEFFKFTNFNGNH